MRFDENDPLFQALRSLPAPALADDDAALVLARARAHLEPAASESRAQFHLTVVRALVPGLLAATAVDHVAETVKAVDAVYGQAPPVPGSGPKPGRR